MTEYIVEYYPNGNKKFETWRKNNKFYREDGPAYIEYYENGKEKKIEWMFDNMFHRENGPSSIWYFDNGNIEREEWYLNGKCNMTINSCKEQKPSLSWFNYNGTKQVEAWHINGELQRKDGPAYIEYYESGNIKVEKWYNYGFLHREGDKPAFIEYYEGGYKKRESWYYRDELHRINGPANIEYSWSGRFILWQLFYIYDEEITETKCIKLLYLLKKPIWKIKMKKRRELLDHLRTTKFYENKSDICQMISTYAY